SSPRCVNFRIPLQPLKIGARNRPVQQIEIERVSAETGEALLTSTRDAISGHVTSLHLGDQEYAITLTGNHVANPRNGLRRNFQPCRSTPCQAKRLCVVLLLQQPPDVFPA